MTESNGSDPARFDFRCHSCRLLGRHDLCDWLRGCECAASTCLDRLPEERT